MVAWLYGLLRTPQQLASASSGEGLGEPAGRAVGHGELFDYRRLFAPTATLAVLLPEPSDDVLDLLRGLEIQAVVRTAGGFSSLL